MRYKTSKALEQAVKAAAVKLGQRKENYGKTLVVLFPDSGERYLSTPLYT